MNNKKQVFSQPSAPAITKASTKPKATERRTSSQNMREAANKKIKEESSPSVTASSLRSSQRQKMTQAPLPTKISAGQKIVATTPSSRSVTRHTIAAQTQEKQKSQKKPMETMKSTKTSIKITKKKVESSPSSSSEEKQAASSENEEMKENTPIKIKAKITENAEESAPIENKNSLYAKQVVKSESSLEKRFSIKQPQPNFDNDEWDVKVCHICYQGTKYPDINSDDDDESMEEPCDSKMLYQLAYCKTCHVPVHWGCLGTDIQLREVSKQHNNYYFFECDKCKYQREKPAKFALTQGIACVACDSSQGLLKAFEIKEASDSMETDVNLKTLAFYHPICAMSFPDNFKTIVTSDSINFTLKDNSLENNLFIQRKDRTHKATKCFFCKSSHGLFLHSQNEPSLQAHVFCILNQQAKEEYNSSDNYQWCFQVLHDKDMDYAPVIRVVSGDQKLKYCECNKPSDGMVQCDSCQIWFHNVCIDEYDRELFDDEKFKYQCNKCKAWRTHLEEHLLDIIYRKKSFKDLLNEDQTYWEGFDSLCNYVKDSDLAINVPVRIFEHLLIIRAWHSLTNYLLTETTEEDLIAYHITEASYLFPQIDTTYLKTELKRKKDLIEEIIAEASDELTLKDLISSDGNSPPTSQVSRDQKLQLIEHNKRVALKAQEIENRCLNEAKMINQSVLDMRKLKEKSVVLQKAVELLEKRQKPGISEVRKLCEQIDELEMAHEGYQSVETIKKILKEYEDWVVASLEELKRATPEEEKVLERLKQLKSSKVGVKLQEAMYKMFKEYLTNKTTIDQARQIVDKSHGLKVNADEESLHLDSLIGIIKQFEQEYQKLEANPQNTFKPSQKAKELLINACCLPIKSTKIDKLLETWHKSCLWQLKAKDFLEDKLNEDQQEELKTTFIKQADDQLIQADFIWTLDRANTLIQDLQPFYFVSQKFIKRVRDKITAISDIKQAVRSHLVNHDCEIGQLKECLKQMEDMETVEFGQEIQRIKEKIKLLIDVKNVNNNQSSMNQSVEMLESIYNRVEEASKPDLSNLPINIKCDMKWYLQSKVQTAKALKQEFSSLLANEEYQNSFNRNMAIKLKEIVNRADQEYHIDMKREQRIIENIPYSEEWFLPTFESLKKFTGKALMQVDFKDFIQLSTVLLDEKSCVTLLKTLTKTSDHLVGAAYNLWKSISGVKWLFEVKRLLSGQDEQLELKKIVELDLRAREVLGIKYQEEIERGHAYSKTVFFEFHRIVDCIRQFDEKFGNYQKLIRTLEGNMHRLQEFKGECEHLTQVLQSNKITSQSGELDLLSKIHTYIDFLQQYQKLTAPLEESKDQQLITTSTKIPYDKAMLLQQLARDQQIPEDLSILKRLKESVARFERFQREYQDYKKYRERAIKRSSTNITAMVETRFTVHFVKKLIEEWSNLQIEQVSSEADGDMYFDREMLEQDLKSHEKWRLQTEQVLTHLEDDELAVQEDKELREQFQSLQEQMRSLSLYDKELFIRMQVFEWLYSSIDMLNGDLNEDGQPLSIGSWDSKIKQADTFLQQLQQYHSQIIASQQQIATISPLLKNLKNHSIYQRLVWEVDQARTVIDFVLTQRTNQKSLAAKYTANDQLRQQQFNVSSFFRNKQPKQKIEKILDQARRSKIDLAEESRSLSNWLKDAETYGKQYSEGNLFTANSFERLKDIAKSMFISPIDQSDIYLKIKPCLETAEAVKLDLKKIIQEHEMSQIQRSSKDSEKTVKRLKYSRVHHQLQIYNKECKIPGIKEIDTVLIRVQQSKDKLEEAQTLILNISAEPSDVIKQKIDKARKLLSEMDIDMEKKEIEVRRQLFEAELRYIVFAQFFAKDQQIPKKTRKLELEEFKLTFDKEFELVRNHLVDDEVHSKFLELKNQVGEFVRKINKTESKEDLAKLQADIVKECPLIDFTQVLTDKEVQLVLGKKQPVISGSSSRKSSQQQDDSSSSEEEESQVVKRQKLNETGKAKAIIPSKKKVASPSSSSGDESSSSGSSSSGSSSGSESSSDESNNSSDSEESKKPQKKVENSQLNLAQNRARRTITPHMDQDFIYDNPSVVAQHKLAAMKNNQSEKPDTTIMPEALPQDDVQSESSSDTSEKQRKRADKKLKAKKRHLQHQLEEHRKQRKLDAASGHQQQISTQQAPRGPWRSEIVGADTSLGDQISQNVVLQNSLQAFKNKIRESSRLKMREAFEINENVVFSTLNRDEVANVVFDLEEEVFTKAPEADSFYRKRIADICENIKFLKSYKDISDLMAIKKSLSYGKLLQNHYAFKEDMIKLDLKIKERRQQIKEMTATKKLSAVSKPIVQEEAKAIIESSETIIKTQPADDGSFKPGTQTSQLFSDDDDVESYDSNPALFSDEEEQMRANPLQAIQNIIQQSKQSQPVPVRTQSAARVAVSTYDPMYQQPQQQQPMFMNQMRAQYNPFEIFEAKHLGMTNRYMNSQVRNPSEPILYDPLRIKQTGQAQVKNVAPPGSLLRVWEGSLELAKDQQIKCSLYSQQDIGLFQTLPEFASTLQLKGKAKIEDVIQHFLRLKRDRRLIKGWVTRKNAGNQENNDKYCKLFEELEQTGRSALFNVFQGVTLYVVPINSKVREFIKEMGLEGTYKQHDTFLDDNEENHKVAEEGLEEETHSYVFLSQIKTTFDRKTSFLNPEVLKVAKPKVIVANVKQDQFSPITSDEEQQIKAGGGVAYPANLASGLPPNLNVKQEESGLYNQGGNMLSARRDPRLQNMPPQQQPGNFYQPPGVVYGAPPQTTFSGPGYSAPSNYQTPGVSYPGQFQSNPQPYPQQQQQQQEDHHMNEGDDNDIDIDELIQSFKSNNYSIQTIQAKLMTVIYHVKGENEAKLTEFLKELIQSMNSTPKQSTQIMVKEEPQHQQYQDTQAEQLGYSYPSNIGLPPSSQQQQQQYRGYQQQQRGGYGPGTQPQAPQQLYSGQPPAQYSRYPQQPYPGGPPPSGIRGGPPPQQQQFYQGAAPPHGIPPGGAPPSLYMAGSMPPGAPQQQQFGLRPPPPSTAGVQQPYPPQQQRPPSGQQPQPPYYQQR